MHSSPLLPSLNQDLPGRGFRKPHPTPGWAVGAHTEGERQETPPVPLGRWLAPWWVSGHGGADPRLGAGLRPRLSIFFFFLKC